MQPNGSQPAVHTLDKSNLVALSEQQHALTAIFGLAEIGLAELSAEGRFLRVNDAFCALMRRSREEMLQTTLMDVAYCDDVGKSLQAVGRLFAGEAPMAIEKRYVMPDGSLIWTTNTISLLQQQDKQVILVVTADLTQRREAEQKLADFDRTLATALEEALSNTKRLQQIREREIFKATTAYQESRQKKIYDNVQEGLSQLLFATKLVLDQISIQPEDVENQKRVDQAKELIASGIREGHQITGQLSAAVLENYGLSAALRELCRRHANSCNIDLQIDDEGLEIPLEIQRAVFRITQELVSNMARHSLSEQSAISMERAGNLIRLSVKDNGVGFDAHQKSSLGIGLIGIKSKIELLQGSMQINSAPGKGTAIEIMIPVQV